MRSVCSTTFITLPSWSVISVFDDFQKHICIPFPLGAWERLFGCSATRSETFQGLFGIRTRTAERRKRRSHAERGNEEA
jgi:uncharacterized protein (DUF2384 family)